MTGDNNDDVDPLDAFMASLCVPSAAADEQASTMHTVAAANALDWSTARRWRRAGAPSRDREQYASNDRSNSNDSDAAATAYDRGDGSSYISAVVKNRRYRRLQQLLQGEKAKQDLSQPGAMEPNPDDWYFSDAMMQQRNPALFHFHVGQYLPAVAAAEIAAATTAQADAATTAVSSKSKQSTTAAAAPTDSGYTDPKLLLSSFLLDTNDRREMEMRRALEQQLWGAFVAQDEAHARARETALFEQDAEEEEEESDDESDDGADDERKRDVDSDSAATPAVDSVPISERRQLLVDLMAQRFLHGSDDAFIDYNEIDSNAALDDLEQMQRDAEDAYFATSATDDAEVDTDAIDSDVC